MAAFIDGLGSAAAAPTSNSAGSGTNTSTSADQFRNQILSLMATAMQAALPRIVGTFTLDASATTVVPQTGSQSTSQITLTPLNAAAATLMGSNKALYVSARTQGASFTVATASGVAAAGTEQFQYTMLNLV